MRFFVLFLSLVLPVLAVSDPLLDRASDLCRGVAAEPSFDYEALFSPSVASVAPKHAVSAILAALFRAHGACDKATRDDLSESPLGIRIYFLTLRDGYRSVWKLHADANGKLDHLRAEAVIRPANYPMQMRESMVAMRDGTRLHTYVFGKDLSRRAPVVLQRTPYLRQDSLPNYAFLHASAPYFVERGYQLVLQGVRGTGGSAGDYRYLSRQEIDDGYDAVEWVAAQPFSDGKVALSGTSYDGFTAIAGAIGSPPSLKVVLAGGYPTDAFTDAFMRNGALLTSALEYLNYSQLDSGVPFNSGFTETIYRRLLGVTDLRQYDQAIFGRTIPEWQKVADAFADPTHAFWKERQIHDRLREIRVPTYHIAGMGADGDMPDVIRAFREIEAHSSFRDLHRLILGSWDHGNSTPYLDGSGLSPFMRDRFDKLLAFYLRGEDTAYVREPRVQIASAIDGRFWGADRYPLPGLKERTLYFGKGGALRDSPVAREERMTYRMIPTLGNLAANPDPVQALIFSRKFQAPMNLLGAIDLNLYLSVDTPQTDLILYLAKLDVHGQQQSLTSCLAASRITGGQPRAVHLEHCPVRARLLPGETLQVFVTSNLFPVLARNTNRAVKDFYDGSSEASVTLYASKQYPSRMTLRLEP